MNDDRRHGQRAGIDPARIEAAARALDPTSFEHLAGHADDECPDCKAQRDRLREKAMRAIEAAFPELIPEHARRPSQGEADVSIAGVFD